MTSILLAGDGHGAHAVFRGLCNDGFKPDICTNDPELKKYCETNEVQFAETIHKWTDVKKDHLVITAGYKPLIPQEVIKKSRIMNIHYSLLPKYRGLHSIIWALLNGEEYVGYTIHEIDQWIDHGPIVYQKAIKVCSKTSWEIMLDLDRLVENEIGFVVRNYLNGTIKSTIQDHDLATYVSRRNVEDCRVDWNWTADYMERFLRALVTPYPRPYFVFKGKKYEISSSKVIHRYYHEIPGHVVNRDEKSIWVKLQDGLLQIFELIHDGKEYKAVEIFPTTGYRIGEEH